MYLHEIGDESASFSKQDMQNGYVSGYMRREVKSGIPVITLVCAFDYCLCNVAGSKLFSMLCMHTGIITFQSERGRSVGLFVHTQVIPDFRYHNCTYMCHCVSVLR